MHRFHAAWITLGAIMMVFSLTGCGRDRPTLPQRAVAAQNAAVEGDLALSGGDRGGPTLSISECAAESLFAALRSAYVRRDLDAYQQLLAPDFCFVFSPEDVRNPVDPTPPTWGLLDEITAHDHLFHDALVDRIELTFQLSAPVPSSEYFPRTWMVEMSQIDLRVYTHKHDGTPWEYRVSNGTRKGRQIDSHVGSRRHSQVVEARWSSSA